MAVRIRHALSHLSDETLCRDLTTLVANGNFNTAEVLAHIAEFDARKLYRPQGHPSMFEYCVRELHLSEQSAYKRIHAARAARRFPAVFDAVAGGRLHLSAVVLLAAHLTPGTAEELLAAATHKTKAEIERLLAERFPQPELPTRLRAIPSPPSLALPAEASQLSPGKVEAPPPPQETAALELRPVKVEAPTRPSSPPRIGRARAPNP